METSNWFRLDVPIYDTDTQGKESPYRVIAPVRTGTLVLTFDNKFWKAWTNGE